MRSIPQHALIKAILVGLVLLSAKVSAADLKGEAPPPPRKIYKGEIESTDYGNAVIPGFAPAIYTSEMYHGDLEGADYYPPTDYSLHDGFYLGIQGGYDSYKIRESINIVAGGATVFGQNPQLSAVGGTGTLFGGYGRYFDEPLYIAAEIFYNVPSATTTQIVNSDVASYYLRTLVQNTYGLSFLPGLKLYNSTMIYLRLGYTRLQIKTYEASSALDINNAQQNGLNAIHYGLGLEVDIFRNFSLRGDYTYINGRSITTATGTMVTPSDNQFLIGLNFHFF